MTATKLGVGAGALLAAFFILLLGELVFRREYATHAGTVIDRVYTPSQTHVGTGVGSSGQSVTTVSTTAEQWLLLVEIDGRPRSLAVDAATWGRTKPGDSLRFSERGGRLFGWFRKLSIVG